MTTEYQRTVIDPGDEFSKVAFAVCQGSFDNSPAIKVIEPKKGNFRGSRGYRWSDRVLESMLRHETHEEPQSDGAGGKLQFHTLLGTPEAFIGAACEAITMCVDDNAAGGGLPVLILSSNIDVKGINEKNFHLCEAVLVGLDRELRRQELVLMTGETAIMKHSITAFCDTGAPEQLIMTWSMTSLGLSATNMAPNGSTITPGMTLVGFRDKGYRCNGGTAFTNIILGKWGPSIEDIANNPEARAFIEKLVVPSQSYAGTIARLRGWRRDGTLGKPLAKIHGVAHITGGGIWGKLPEILPPGVGARIDSSVQPASVLLEGQRLSAEIGKPISDHECHGTFHGGYGMIAVCESEQDAWTVIQEGARDGHDPILIGRTTESPEGKIMIKSHFAEGGWLSSLNPPG